MRLSTKLVTSPHNGFVNFRIYNTENEKSYYQVNLKILANVQKFLHEPKSRSMMDDFIAKAIAGIALESTPLTKEEISFIRTMLET